MLVVCSLCFCQSYPFRLAMLQTLMSWVFKWLPWRWTPRSCWLVPTSCFLLSFLTGQLTIHRSSRNSLPYCCFWKITFAHFNLFVYEQKITVLHQQRFGLLYFHLGSMQYLFNLPGSSSAFLIVMYLSHNYCHLCLGWTSLISLLACSPLVSD